MRARVWTAGGVEANMQQTSSNFQDTVPVLGPRKDSSLQSALHRAPGWNPTPQSGNRPFLTWAAPSGSGRKAMAQGAPHPPDPGLAQQ
eukprot:1137845-Pelagomonas_calceolata.AAC.1